MANQDAIAPLKNAYQDFVETILPLSTDQFLSPMNGWAPRDVVAHLVGWNSLMIEASMSILAGKPPAYYADTPNDYSNINAGYTAKFSSRSKEELLAQLKASLDGLETFLLGLPEAELLADHGVRHYSGNPATVGKIITSLSGDYNFHTKQMKDWFKTR